MTLPVDAAAAVQAARNALQRGDRAEARRLAQQAAACAPDSEEPWLILAELASPRASLAYYQRALQANPTSERARAALEQPQARGSGNIQPNPAAPAVPVRDLTAAVSDTSRPAYASPVTPVPPSRQPFLPTSTLLQAVSILLAVVLLFGGFFIIRGLSGSRVGVKPTPTGCPLSLAVAGQPLTILPIPPAPDGTWQLPPGSGQAFWVEGTNRSVIILLNPSAGNLAWLQTLKEGDTAVFISRDCAAATYSLGQLAEGVLDPAAQLNQNLSQVTLYLPSTSASPGYILVGALQAGELQRASTPDPNSQLLEISLGEIKTSPDGSRVTVQITVQNYAKNPVQFNAADTSLIPDGAAPLILQNAEPAMPLQFKPGTIQEVHLTFPRPTTPSATLRVFSVEYTIDGY